MLLWRVATSGKFNDTYLSICNEWSLNDLLEALEILDIQNAVEKEQIAKTKEK